SSHLEASQFGRIEAIDDYEIVGGALEGHMHAYAGSTIKAWNIEVTLTGTPAFSGFFCGVNWGYVDLMNTTYTGAATGVRFLIHQGGVVSTYTTYDPTYFPGNINGHAHGGGQFQDTTRRVLALDQLGYSSGKGAGGTVTQQTSKS